MAEREQDDEGGAAASALKKVKKVVILVVGLTVVLLGIALLVLPGPGILVVMGGFAILSLEFAWARRWKRKVLRLAKEAGEKAKEAAHKLKEGITGEDPHPGPA